MKNSPNRPLKPFKIESAKDLTFVWEVGHQLRCSQATTYRTLNSCGVPIAHFVEVLRHIRFISKFNLYRLVKTAAFKKYFLALTEYAPIPDAEPYEETFNTSIEEAKEKLQLTDWQMDAGIKSGLIPAIKVKGEIKISGWFLPAVEGMYPCF